MKFEITLELLAARFGFDADALLRFAAEDTLTGWDGGYGAWPVGSLWAVEGRTLYALVRALQPDLVVEVGTHHGASATHIAAALKANGKGRLVCLDPSESAGAGISDDLRDVITIINRNGAEYLSEQDDDSIGMIFEDADHSAELCASIATLAKSKLMPGGVLAMHDAAHWVVGENVRAGLDNSGISYSVYLAEPSDCGLAVWRKPGLVQMPTPDTSDTAPDATSGADQTNETDTTDTSDTSNSPETRPGPTASARRSRK